MATRFVATEECDASPAFKEAYVNCRQEDITIIQSPVGMPGRAIGNEFLRRAKARGNLPEVLPLALHHHLQGRKLSLLYLGGAACRL